MSKKLPAFQFYPGDWRKDPAVQACSIGARGFWFEMLCLMHESEERGFLLVGGHPPDISTLARLTGTSKAECQGYLKELEDRKVFAKDEKGVVFCKRIVRDEAARQKNIEDGKKGGNPMLITKPTDKAWVKGEDKATADSKNGSSSSPSNSVSSASANSTSDSKATAFMDWWHQEYQTRFKQKYVVSIKETFIARQLSETLDLSLLQECAARFFDTPDDFVLNAGFTITIFATRINRLAMGEVHSRLTPTQIRNLKKLEDWKNSRNMGEKDQDKIQ